VSGAYDGGLIDLSAYEEAERERLAGRRRCVVCDLLMPVGCCSGRSWARLYCTRRCRRRAAGEREWQRWAAADARLTPRQRAQQAAAVAAECRRAYAIARFEAAEAEQDQAVLSR
jgi:hypothetical protein